MTVLQAGKFHEIPNQNWFFSVGKIIKSQKKTFNWGNFPMFCDLMIFPTEKKSSNHQIFSAWISIKGNCFDTVGYGENHSTINSSLGTTDPDPMLSTLWWSPQRCVFDTKNFLHLIILVG
jgi:hypothetical protein